MSMTELPLNRAFMLLEPGPVILVTTNDGAKNNIMTISWHIVLNFTPKLALATGPWNHSFETLMKTRECVIAIPGADLLETTVRIGAVSGTEVDKFKEFGLTAGTASLVKAPLIDECLGCIECEVTDYVKEHNLVVLTGKKAWINPDRNDSRTFHAVGDGTFVIDGETVNYRNLMESKVPEGV